MMTEGTNPKCGLILPIAKGDGYTEDHWKKVEALLETYIRECGFEPNLVSRDHIITPIHKNIVQNIFDYPIVVCDVSSRNPNVLFELGLRFAFGKPAVLLKDNTDERYIFDINFIPQIRYPKSLANGKALAAFKMEFCAALKNTYSHYQKHTTDSQFLKLFNIPNPVFTNHASSTADREEIHGRTAFFQTAMQLLKETQSFRSTFLGPIFLHPKWLVTRRDRLTVRPNFDHFLMAYIKANARKYPGQIRIILRNTSRYVDKLDDFVKPHERQRFINDMLSAIDELLGTKGQKGVDICCHNPGHFKIDMIYDTHYLEGSRKSENTQITNGYMFSGIDQVNNAKKDFDAVFDRNVTDRADEIRKLKDFIQNLWA